MKYSEYTGWQDLPTLQSKEILSELTESKEARRASLIISDTGLGKSNTIKLFMKKYPQHTYLITVGDSFSLADLINELMRMLGLSILSGKNSRFFKMRNLKRRLAELGEQGDIMIILDEAENMRHKALKAIKELYDAVIEHCSITLIGTDQIITLLTKKIQGQSVPQLWRRFKAGTRFITPLNKARDFKPFFDKHITGNNDVQDILIQECENYGELHDYLDPVLRHCAKKKMELTEEVFRFFHKLPAKRQLKRA
jgi:DNA transposition AAA+ family ATPase